MTAYLDDETMLLSATTAGKHPKDHFDFFPLTIDVEERMYAVGQIPGSFFRSEGRPGRGRDPHLPPDRPPAAPDLQEGPAQRGPGRHHRAWRSTPTTPYDVLAINAASLSTQLSGLPFSGPVGGVRVALIEGQWVAFPTHSQLEDAVFDMVVAGRVTETGDVAIMMVEAEATEQTCDLVQGGAQAPTEEVVAGGLDAAKPFIKQLVRGAGRAGQAGRQAGPGVPDLPRLRGRRLRRRRGRREGRHRRRADHRRQAGARGRASTRSRPRCSRSSPASSRVARRRSARRSAR